MSVDKLVVLWVVTRDGSMVVWWADYSVGSWEPIMVALMDVRMAVKWDE